MREEEQNIEIREKLLNLPKVKASNDFVNALQRKINLSDAKLNQKKIPDEIQKESIWIKLFGKKRNPWLIPSLSLTIVVVFVISVYILNSSKKISEIPTMSDFQKKDSPSGMVQENKPVDKDKTEETYGQDIANDITLESRQKDSKTPSVTDKITTDQSSPIPAPMEMKMEQISKPSTSEPVKSETGKIEYKKEEKIFQDMEQNEQERVPKSNEGRIKSELPLNKVVPSEEKDKNDVIEKKGLIEKRKVSATKKPVKTATDSTKIDKNVLEKIKEEILKEK